MKKFNKFTIYNSAFHLIIGIAFSITIGFGNPVLASLGFSSTQIGIIYSISMLLGIFLQSGISYIVEDKKWITTLQSIQLLAICSTILGFFMLIATSNHLLISIIFMLALSFSTAGYPLLAALSIDCINSGNDFNFGLARAMGAIGFATLGFTGGYFATIFSEISLYYIYIFIHIVLLILTFKYPKYKYISKNTDDNSESIIGMLINNKLFRQLIIGVCLIFFAHNIINNFLKEITDYVGATKVEYGIAIGLSSILELPTLIFFGKIVAKFKIFDLLKIGAFFMSLKVIIETLAVSFLGIFLAQFTQPFAYAIFTPAIIFCMNDIVKPNNQIKAQLMIGVASMGIGGGVGNIIGGILINTIGIKFTMYITSLISILAVIIFFNVDNNKIKQRVNSITKK